MSTLQVKLVLLAAVFMFLSSMFGGLFHTSMGMDVSGGVAGCPFVSTGEKLCDMSLGEHVGAWESTFVAIVPGLTFLTFIVAAALLFSAAPNIFANLKFWIPAVPIKVSERLYIFSYRPLQELFSNGILHPKLF